MPTVSVVLPTYDRADVLHRAIESVLGQTLTDLELVVVDDGSTDRTPAVVEGFGDDRLTYVRFEENAGANAARNAGIRRSSGKYVSFLDSDDEFLPGHLETVVDRLEGLPADCMGVAVAAEIVEDGAVVDRDGVPEGDIDYGAILRGNVIGGFSCVTFRRACFDAVGPLDPDLASWQDFDLFIRVLDGHTMRGVDEVEVRYHEREDAISSDYAGKLRGQERLLRKHRHRFTPETVAYWLYARAIVHAEAGELGLARRYLRRAARTDPSDPRYGYHLLASLLGRRGFEASVRAKRGLKRLLDRQ
jgi:glycosyltransferase involved in cell wall biosynthesis